ncbi:MAG: pilin [Patescibacteria group bacterium]
MIIKKTIFIVLSVVGVLGFYSLTEAAELRLYYSPPCPFSDESPLGECLPGSVGDESLAIYIRRIYQFAVAISGILAVGMIVVGGIYISVSAGSPDKQKEGREMIVSAIWGIVLVLGSYLILRTVNPRLVELPTPDVEEIKNLGQYRLARFECPTAGQTGCFFDDDGNACDFQDLSAVCNALESASPACKEDATYPCACKNCRVLGEDFFAVKASACSGETATSVLSTLGKCMLERDTWGAFGAFYRSLGGSVPKGTGTGEWRVTEAFPPTIPHNSRLHYDGRAFDFGRDGVDIANQTPPPTDREFCEEVEEVVTTARRFFRTVIIEGLTPAYCPVLRESNLPEGIIRGNFSNTTGFHIHVERPEITSE